MPEVPMHKLGNWLMVLDKTNAYVCHLDKNAVIFFISFNNSAAATLILQYWISLDGTNKCESSSRSNIIRPPDNSHEIL